MTDGEMKEYESACSCGDSCGCGENDCGQGGCSENGCGSTPDNMIEPSHPMSNIKKVIGVVSGKGGVGKSLTTSLLAVELRRRGHKVGILDADITGPSIPKIFGLHEKAEGADGGLFPVMSKTGIPVMSINLLLENEKDPVLWRGPVLGNVVKQFWTDVIWGDLDFLLVDMPPGTGDVPMTVFQSLPVDGIVIVTTPQALVAMIVEKAVNMARLMDIPVVGIIENMSYLICPDCEKEIYIFGQSKTEQIAGEYGLDVIAEVPVDAKLASACDKGLIELFNESWMKDSVDKLERLPKKFY